MDRARRVLFVAIAVMAVAVSAAAAQEYRETDIREANVMGVQWEGSGGEYRFDVTLYHDDDGEDGYADWWQVETPDGERLERRDLAHPHGTQRFTRSADVTVPSDVGTVVVRGHDQTHGYGGKAMLAHLGNGTARAVDQGSEPRTFGADGDGGGSAADPPRPTDGGDANGSPSDADRRPSDGPSEAAGDGASAPEDGEGLPGLGAVAGLVALLAAGAAISIGYR